MLSISCLTSSKGTKLIGLQRRT